MKISAVSLFIGDVIGACAAGANQAGIGYAGGRYACYTAGMTSARPGAAPPPAAQPHLTVPPDSGSPLRRQEGPVMRGARHLWNAAISLMLGTMIGLLGYQFGAEAVAHLWPDQKMLADFVRALFWTLGIAATGVLFFSYYLDDTGR